MSKDIQFRMRYHKKSETLYLVKTEGHVPIGKPLQVSCSSKMTDVMKQIQSFVRINFPESGEYFENLDLKSHGDAHCKNIMIDIDLSFDDKNRRMTLISIDVFGNTNPWHHTAEFIKWSPLRLIAHHLINRNSR